MQNFEASSIATGVWSQLFRESLFSFKPPVETLMSPVEWVENHRYLVSESKFKGFYKFHRTPYLKAVLEACLDPSINIVAIQKSVQIGLSALIENLILYEIVNNPSKSNIGYFVRDWGLAKRTSLRRISPMFQNSNYSHLIKSSVEKSTKTGDTIFFKEYVGGATFTIGVTSSPSSVRQEMFNLIIIDDAETSAISDQAGSAIDLFIKRSSSLGNDKKIIILSSPERDPSQIDYWYREGDQNRAELACPRCGEFIELYFKLKGKKGEKLGLIYETTEYNRLIEESVKYRCQKCYGEFTEEEKYNSIEKSHRWVATAEPKRNRIKSFFLNTLYNNRGMDGWNNVIENRLGCQKKDEPVNLGKFKVWLNTDLGLPFMDRSAQISTEFNKHQKPYVHGTIPLKNIKEDNAGDVMVVSMGVDIGGNLDDASVDWTIIIKTSRGLIYAIDHGTIGSFQKSTGNKKLNEARLRKGEQLTYDFNKKNSVWPYLDKILDSSIPTDDKNNPKTFKISVAGIDSGDFTSIIYQYVDYRSRKYREESTPNPLVISLKGSGNGFAKINDTVANARESSDNPSLFLVNGNKIKSEIAYNLSINTSNKPISGSFSFPATNKILKKFTEKDYFSQLKSEEKKRKINAEGMVTGYLWSKKHDKSINHQFDCLIYSLASIDVISLKMAKYYKQKDASWESYCNLIKLHSQN